MSPHVDLQGRALSEALCALVTLVGLLPGVSPHVALQVVFLFEELRALVIFGNNLATQDTGPALAAVPMSSQLLKADQPHTAVQAVGHAVVRGQRAQGHRTVRGEEGVMAVHRQWALPFSVDAQDPQLPIVAGHVGGARSIHAQTL